MHSRLRCSIPLPSDYRRNDVLAFHGRDPQGVAERVDTQGFRKGLTWAGHAASLTLRFESDRCEIALAVDGPTDATEDALVDMATRMLGLTQRIEDFESVHRSHAELGPLIARQPGLRVPLAASPFEALTWAITGQQISVRAAVSIRRNLIRLSGITHSSGIACYPGPSRVARLGEAPLRQAGFSATKAQALVALSGVVEAGRLPLDQWTTTPIETIRSRLMDVRGIGPWTVDYTLLRGFGWLDGSLHGDVAVRRKLQRLLGCRQPVDAAFTQKWLAAFSPWRALVAAHLWAMPS